MVFVALFFAFISQAFCGEPKSRVKLTPISNYIWTLAGDNQFLWVGTASGMSRFQKDSGEWTHFEGKNIKSILPDGDKLWVGTLNGFFSFEKKSGEWKEYPEFKNLTVYGISKTPSFICVGTIEKGLGKLNSASGKVEFFDEKDGLPSSRIYALCPDGDDLWIGTAKGLVRYNTENGKFKIFQEEDGLAQNCVASLMLDGNDLWVGTLIGVSKFDKNSGKWESWSSYKPFTARSSESKVSDDLEIADTTVFSFAKDNESVYLGTNNGLYTYKKSSGVWMQPIKFKRLIKSIYLSGNDLYFAWSESIWDPGRLEKKKLDYGKYQVCAKIMPPSVAKVEKKGNTYFYDAMLFKCHNSIKASRRYSFSPCIAFIYRDEEMSLDFSLEESGKDILLTFHGVNGDHVVNPAPAIELCMNDQPVATVRSSFLPENLAGNDAWSEMKIAVQASFLKKDNHLTIKNLGPDWWMIDGMKITVLDKKISEVCFDNFYAGRCTTADKKPTTEKTLKKTTPLIVDGKPFFPLSLCSPLPDALGDMQKAGFNCVTHLNPRTGPLVETKRSYFDLAQKYGLKVFTSFGHPAQTAPQGEKLDLAVFEKVINEVGDHPALAAWYSNDEPESGMNYNKHYEEVNSPAAMKKLYQFIRSRDPRKLPIWLNLCISISYPEIAKEYADACDLLSEDHYSLQMSQTIRWADYLMEATAGTGKPALICLQSYYNPNSSDRFRSPSQLEIKCMSYLSVVRQMRGLMFFVYIDPKLTLMMFDDLPEEISKLHDIIAGNDAQENVAVKGEGIYALLKDGKDGLYLITVNSSTSAQNAEFKLPDASSGNAEVLFEGRKVSFENGILKDVFKPYERHVYKIGK